MPDAYAWNGSSPLPVSRFVALSLVGFAFCLVRSYASI